MAHIGYKLEGTGPRRVVALHGWFGDQRTYDALLPWLGSEKYSWLMPDLRGYGASKERGGAISLDSVVADVIELVDELGWDDFDVIGHSMSGKFAMRIAQVVGPRVKRIVAVTPVSPGPTPFDPPSRALFESAATSAESREMILKHSTGMRLPSCWSQAMLRRSLDTCEPEVFAAYFRAWADGDCSAGMAKVPQPTLVVVGAHDPAITSEGVQVTLMPLLRHGTLQVVDGAGHYPMDEAPVALAGLIDAFLDSPLRRL